jgi:RNA polymerase-binding transcription factor DksA
MDIDRYRDMLLEERGRVTASISRLHETNSVSLEDETEEAAIDEALQRIDQGTFGACGRCGKPIAEERLEAIPYANRCIDCKRLEERG